MFISGASPSSKQTTKQKEKPKKCTKKGRLFRARVVD
ncbi:hypothetical protein V6Z11_A03G144200 [Gossypium hirsutum]